LKDPKKDFQTKKWPNPSRKRKKRWIESRVRKRQGDAGVGGKNPKNQMKLVGIGGGRRQMEMKSFE
jgi:hypothetical protein